MNSTDELIPCSTEAAKDLVALWAVIIAAVAVLVTYLVYWLQEKSSSRRHTVELHERYHQLDFYRDIRAPAWKISAKWLYLPEPQRAAYRNAVAGGWIDYLEERGVDTLHKWIPNFTISEDPSH